MHFFDGSAKTRKSFLYPFVLLGLLCLFPLKAWSQAGSCTVTSAVLRWATDDEGYIYVNGQSPVSCFWVGCWTGADCGNTSTCTTPITLCNGTCSGMFNA